MTNLLPLGGAFDSIGWALPGSDIKQGRYERESFSIRKGRWRMIAACSLISLAIGIVIGIIGGVSMAAEIQREKDRKRNEHASPCD